MPDYILGDPKHPGSPCYIEKDESPRWAYSEICLTCGRTNLTEPIPAWWERCFRYMWIKAIEPPSLDQ